MNIIRNKVCQNWAKTCTYTPELFFQPTTTDEIRAALKQAREDGKRVRCIGTGSSPAPVCDTNEYIISMTRYNKVLKIDKPTKLVTVQSGITLDDFNHALDKEGLAMIVLPAVEFITIGGILGTGVHGSGKTNGILPSYVTELELLTAEGEIIKCSKTLKPEIFHSALLNLGALGIVLNVTFQCEDSHYIRQSIQSLPFEEGLESFATADTLHGKYAYCPYADRMVKIEIEKTKEQVPASSPPPSMFFGPLRNSGLLELILLIGVYVKFLIPYLDRFLHYLLFGAYNWIVDKNYKVLHFDCLYAQDVCEYSLPIENATAFIRDFRKLIMTNNLKVTGPVDIRFGKANDIYLSQCYQRDCCFLNILSFRPYGMEMPDRKKYFKLYEDLMKTYNGRPHLAKEHTLTAKDFRELYPKFDEFMEVRKKLDPKGLFVNDYVKRHLLTE